MRQIFLDTETTGLDVKSGHRIVEIAAVEVCNRQLTGRHFHYYLNPERESEASALQIHGLTTEFLQDKPKFPDICEDFVQFIENTVLFIHNAPFDVSFLDNELILCNQNTLSNYCTEIIDTLILAKSFTLVNAIILMHCVNVIKLIILIVSCMVHSWMRSCLLKFISR